MARKKNPTLIDRLAEAEVALSDGLALFEDAARSLDAAEALHFAVAKEAAEEATRLRSIADQAVAKAAQAARAAGNVRSLTA